MPGGYQLLSIGGNAKTRWSKNAPWMIADLSLMPSDHSGLVNLCPFATDICRENCLGIVAGRNRTANTMLAKIKRTRLYVDQPELFRYILALELDRFKKWAAKKGAKPAVRLNTYSDIPWEKVLPWIFNGHKSIQFYDYTKNPIRYSKFLGDDWPSNYDLSFSLSDNNKSAALGFLEKGGTVSAVYGGASMPSEWHGYPTVNGDLNDLRFLDPAGHVVCLKAKGSMRKPEASAFWMENL